MKMDESMINQKFLIKKINSSPDEIKLLRTIGISEGCEVTIVGNGYFEGSLLVINKDVLLQLNPYFINKISGEIVKEKRK